MTDNGELIGELVHVQVCHIRPAPENNDVYNTISR
jgi:hypothetical protein